MYRLWCSCGYSIIKEKPIPLYCPRCSKQLNIISLEKFKKEQEEKTFNFAKWLYENNVRKEVAILTDHYHFGDKLTHFFYLDYLTDVFSDLIFYTNEFVNTSVFPEFSVKLLQKDNLKYIEDETILNNLDVLPFSHIIITTPPRYFLHNYQQFIKYFDKNKSAILYKNNNKQILQICIFDIFNLFYSFYDIKFIVPFYNENIKREYDKFFVHYRYQNWASYKNISLDNIFVIQNALSSVYKNNYTLYLFSDIEIKTELPSQIQVIYTFNTHLKEIVEIVQKCCLAFVPESGFILLAEALRIPIVGINLQAFLELKYLVKKLGLPLKLKDIIDILERFNFGNPHYAKIK